MYVPRTRTNYGDRSFSVNGPAVWNSLPVDLRAPDISIDIFKNQLKAFLFTTVYWLRICGLGEFSALQMSLLYLYFRFGRPCCYFRFSLVVAIIWGHFLWRWCSRNVRLCYLNYNNKPTYSGSVFVTLLNMTIKFRQFHKNSHVVFNVMPNNVWCTDWRPDCCILYPLHIQKSHTKGQRSTLNSIFYWFKNWAGAFLRQAQYEG